MATSSSEIGTSDSVPSADVPIIVDGLTRTGDGGTTLSHDLARCLYLSIQADDPSPGWHITLAGRPFPFLMVGLEGILYAPSATDTEFVDANQIDDLIATIEQAAGGVLRVDLQSLFIPTIWLDSACRFSEQPNPLERGSVFRVDVKLLSVAWQYLIGTVDIDDLLKAVTAETLHSANILSVLRFSPKETAAFRDWSGRNIRQYQGFTRSSPP
jgi:hypothetical protein